MADSSVTKPPEPTWAELFQRTHGRLPNTIAIDPGGTTGVAMRLNGQLFNFECRTYKELWDYLVPELDYIVCERFATSGKLDYFGKYTIQLVGSIEGIAYSHKIPYLEHSPQNRYPWMAESYETLYNLYAGKRKNFSDHEQDSLAHLLCHECVGTELKKADRLAKERSV